MSQVPAWPDYRDFGPIATDFCGVSPMQPPHRLKQHPFFDEIDLPSLMQDVFMYSNNLSIFIKEITIKKNKLVSTSALIGIKERLKQAKRNPLGKVGIEAEISRLEEQKADLELHMRKE